MIQVMPITRFAVIRCGSARCVHISQFYSRLEAVDEMLDESGFVNVIGAFRRHRQLTPVRGR
jgi:hypothetical protein